MQLSTAGGRGHVLQSLVCGFIFKETVWSRTTCCRRRCTVCIYNIKYAGERVRDVYDVSRTTAVARGRPAAVRRANAVRTPHAATTATPHHRNKKNQIESKTGRASLLTRVPWYDHPVPSARARVRMWVCVYGNNIIHAHAHATPRRYRAGECVHVVYMYFV